MGSASEMASRTVPVRSSSWWSSSSRVSGIVLAWAIGVPDSRSTDGSASSVNSTSTGDSVSVEAAAAGLGQRGREMPAGDDAPARVGQPDGAPDGRRDREVVVDAQAVGGQRVLPRRAGRGPQQVRDVVAKHGPAPRGACRATRWCPAGGCASAPGRVVGVALVEHRDAPADALERLDALALEPDQHGGRVLVGAPPDLLRVAVALGDDLLRPDLRGTRQLPLLDQERGLLLGAGQDPLGLLLGALDEAGRSPR